MKEIHPNLFIGDQLDYESDVAYRTDEEWSIVHACKEPYHRGFVGYTTKGAPKDHPDYLFARRGERLALNLVDAEKIEWISDVAVKAAIGFVFVALSKDRKVLIHCNQGMSRSPTIGLMYLGRTTKLGNLSFVDAVAAFTTIYPAYNPGEGMYQFAKANWGRLCDE